MFLKSCQAGMQFSKKTFASIPVSFKFGNVPLVFCTREGMEDFGSLIVNPLYLDSATISMRVSPFARICIEIQANKDVPKSVFFYLVGKEALKLEVELSWKAPPFTKCEIYGHSTSKCPQSSARAIGQSLIKCTNSFSRTNSRVLDFPRFPFLSFA